MPEDWKKVHADESEKALEHELVTRVVEEFAGNMGFSSTEGLPIYGLTKVCGYVAQVARAQALGFDPDLLRMSDEEADAEMLRRARMAVAAGKPVWAVGTGNDGLDVQRLD